MMKRIPKTKTQTLRAVCAPRSARIRGRRRLPGRAAGFVLLALLLLAGASCTSDDRPSAEPPAPVGRNHTIMVYLTGTSLLRFYTQNIEGMCNAVDAAMLAENRIVVCYQPTDRSSALVQEVRYDADRGKGVLETLKTISPFEASDPEDVAQMFACMQAAAPADTYGVIIGCHGKAWVPASSGTLRIHGKNLCGDYWTPADGALPTRSFGDAQHELDIAELAAVLEGLATRPEYLIFDACFMANIETLYDLRRSADYIVASPCEVMGIGFPYDQFVPALLSDADTASKMRQTCENFYDYYDAQSGYYRSGCISMTVTAQLDALAGVMRRINAAPRRDYDPRQLQIYEALSSPLLFDFGHYVNSVCDDPALLADFEAQMALAFPAECRLHTESFYSAYNQRLNPIVYYTGVSISEPSEVYTEENKRTSWYRATH